MISDIVKVFVPTVAAFLIGIGITPLVAHYLYTYKLWKKQSVQKTIDGREALVSALLHKDETKQTPRMGGVVIWLSVTLTALVLWGLARFTDLPLFEKLDFISRNQTWIPLATLLVGGLVGLIDDFLGTQGGQGKGSYIGGGLSLKIRLAVVTGLSLFIGWWFYDKLDVTAIALPFDGILELGVLIIPLFVLVTLFLYASGVIDGIDGLAGGLFTSIFSAYAVIAYYDQQFNLAAFAGALAGATLAFLWFNIPPARFYMSETGTMGLTMTVVAIAFLTDTLGSGYGVAALPLIALPLIVTVCSVILQLLSKRFRNGKKIFQVAPLHHHFEAIGWPGYKVTMRYWVIGIISAIAGVTLALVA